ncbi:DUF1127 domain-containing protein [Pseudomonas sp. Gutcm_11s]|uniref:DUF1127 domain-containing protein n=1 Tax=Pseudomonas sp. Gutcm_11s TaxID=3026088 RepID=UPI00235E923B|nr:DUF1127 domain-containing protein [Pseudomonas sp. Gutcm_11s]MDD0841610.1 DUF1127 domain-containing protein [Pseudomonas sp. Gutcm_11s]
MKSQKGYALAGSPSFAVALRGIGWKAWWMRLRRWRELARQRRQLAMLDESALKDMGLTRGDVMQECERPFWDDPQQH